MWLLTFQLFKNSIDTQQKLRLNLHSLSGVSELLEYRRKSSSMIYFYKDLYILNTSQGWASAKLSHSMAAKRNATIEWRINETISTKWSKATFGPSSVARTLSFVIVIACYEKDSRLRDRFKCSLYSFDLRAFHKLGSISLRKIWPAIRMQNQLRNTCERHMHQCEENCLQKIADVLGICRCAKRSRPT